MNKNVKDVNLNDSFELMKVKKIDYTYLKIQSNQSYEIQ